MEDLVLQALESLDPQTHGSVHSALNSAPQAKPTLNQQRAAVMY